MTTSKVRAPRARRKNRAVVYVAALVRTVAAGALVFASLALVQATAHPFDAVLARAQNQFVQVDAVLSSRAFAGISLGSLVMVGFLAVLPALQRGVRRRQFAVSFWRGILSAGIFLASDKFYRFVREIGALYYTAGMALFLAVTLILVELVSRSGRAEEEADTRTELLASIASGLAFALLVQGGEYLLR